MTRQLDLEALIDRISEMEEIFDALTALLRTRPDAFRIDSSARALLTRLTEYYEGGQWLKDFEADEAGLLPRDLKRGVLSEDGVYNLLCEIADIEE